jgi:type II secretory pathway pseudopilin PulG
MAFDDNTDLNEIEAPEPSETPPQETGNRTFVIVAVSLGAIMLLTLACIIVYGLVYLPSANQAKQTQAAQAFAQQTAMAVSAQQTMVALNATPTFTATLPPTKAPASPTATQVVNKAATASPTAPQDNAATQTVAALYTKAALTQTALPNAPTALPTGGFADEVGLPGLLALGGVLIVVIFLARRLRTAS